MKDDDWGAGFDRLFDGSPECMALVSDDLRLTRLNEAAKFDITHWSNVKIGLPLLGMLTHEDRFRAKRSFADAAQGEPASMTMALGTQYIDWRIWRMGDHFVLSGRDVTEQIRRNEELYRKANYDSVTGLPTRLLLRDRFMVGLAQTRREKRRAVLVFLDLDNFKTLNDTHGHHFGDEVLKMVGFRLLAMVRETDTVTRLGGDEFTIFLPMVQDTSSVSEIVDRLMAPMSNPIQTSIGPLVVGVSYGYASFPDDGDELETLLRKSDALMYKQKASRKGLGSSA